jgi:hypothetical protein
MVMIIVPSHVLQTRRMPVEIQTFISPHLWSDILETLNVRVPIL